MVIFDPVTEKKIALSSYQTLLSPRLAAIIYYSSLPQKNDFLRSSIASVRICLLDANADKNSPNCAVILTANNELARTYRNIRSSYGARETVSVMATVNGRVSEYQAGLTLKLIQNYDQKGSFDDLA